jgi:hypothetical protein
MPAHLGPPSGDVVTAVHAELRKLLTLPALLAAAGLACAGTLLFRWSGPGQVGFLVFGVLAATHEHPSQFRTTLLAVPCRLLLAAAKTTALVVVTAPLTLLAPRAALYLLATTLTAAAIGTLFRRALPAVALVLTAHLFACPLLRTRIPESDSWLPDTPRATIPALALAAIALSAATTTITRRDA